MRGSQSQLGELKRSLLGSQPSKRNGLFENTRPAANRLSPGNSRERRTMVEVLQAQKPNFFQDSRQPRTRSVESLKYLPAQTAKPTSVTRTSSKLQGERGLQLNFHRQSSTGSGTRIDMASLRERAASASLDVLRLDLNAVKFSKMLSSTRDHQKDHKLLFGTKTDRSGSLDGSKLGFGSSHKKTSLVLDRNVPSLSGKLDSMLKSVNKKSTMLLFGSGVLDSSVGRSKATTLQFEQSSGTKRSKKYDTQPTTVDSILEGWRTKPLSEIQKHIPSNTLNTWRTEEKLKQRVLFRDGITAFRSKDPGILLSNKEQRGLMAPTTYALAGDDLAAAYTTGSSVPTVSFREDLASPGIPSNQNPLQNYFSFKNGKPPQKEDFSKKLMLGNLNLQSLNEAAQRNSNGFSSAHLKFSSTTERAEVRPTGTGHCLSSRDRTSANQNPYELETLRNSSRPTVELLKQSRDLFDFKKDQFKAVAPVGQN